MHHNKRVKIVREHFIGIKSLFHTYWHFLSVGRFRKNHFSKRANLSFWPDVAMKVIWKNLFWRKVMKRRVREKNCQKVLLPFSFPLGLIFLPLDIIKRILAHAVSFIQEVSFPRHISLYYHWVTESNHSIPNYLVLSLVPWAPSWFYWINSSLVCGVWS